MMTRQEIRSEETKRAILAAAGQLFSERGFDSVTIREIARAAGCSHTTIYLYFKDKDDLLHKLSLGPLTELQQQLESVLEESALAADQRLQQVSRLFLHFCLANRSMYNLFFMTRAERVDQAEPASELSRLRNQLFSLLRQAVKGVLPPSQTEERVLAYARIYFFLLHGMIGAYSGSDEPLESLLERLGSTFDLGLQVMLAGMKETERVGVAH